MPEVVELEVLPEFEGEPAGTPLARVDELDPAELESDGWVSKLWVGGTVFGEQVDLAWLVGLVDGFDGAGPVGAFAIVDLAKIEQGLLDGFTGRDAAVFHNAPVAMLFAVLESFVRTQKHDLRRMIPSGEEGVYGVGLHHRHF